MSKGKKLNKKKGGLTHKPTPKFSPQKVSVENIQEEQKIESPKKSNDMEVHHPHPVHHNKKLKDYFFEFFMLFLAVTAGFFYGK